MIVSSTSSSSATTSIISGAGGGGGGGGGVWTTSGNYIYYNNNVGINVTSPGVALDVDGAIRATNDITAYYSSDKRLKNNIKNIENPLDKLHKINGYSFDWISTKDSNNKDAHTNEGHDIGVIAQEIEEVLPEICITRNNGYKAIRYEKITPLLIEGIKEQQKQIQSQQEKINYLEEQLKKQQEQINLLLNLCKKN